MDPSFRVVKHAEGGYWILYTVGEVQLEVLIARLKREFGCDVSVGNPEIKWQERLRHAVGPLENSFQVGTFKVSLSLQASPLPVSEHDVRLKADFLENAPREILAGLRSALLESADIGFLGKGALVGVQFELLSLDFHGDVPISMIKKACADAVSMLIKPADLVLYEPYMELSVESPVIFAGVITGEIQAREGKVREVNGDGRIHRLRAEVPLRNFFGFSTAVRSISRGTAQYSLCFLDYRMHNM
jgi:elongation factor G